MFLCRPNNVRFTASIQITALGNRSVISTYVDIWCVGKVVIRLDDQSVLTDKDLIIVDSDGATEPDFVALHQVVLLSYLGHGLNAHLRESANSL